MILYTVVVVIAGIVLFLLATVQQRGQDASIDAVQYRAAKKGMLNLVEMIEHDFKNIGSYMYWNESEGRFMAATIPDSVAIPPPGRDSVAVTDGYHHRFRFRGQVDSTQAPVEIRYEWMPAGENIMLSDGTERQLYNVERYVDGSVSGTSTNMVTSMDIRMHPGPGGAPITINSGDARRIEVEIRAVSPLGRGDLIEQTLFRSTYRPIAMSITDNLN